MSAPPQWEYALKKIGTLVALLFGVLGIALIGFGFFLGKTSLVLGGAALLVLGVIVVIAVEIVKYVRYLHASQYYPTAPPGVTPTYYTPPPVPTPVVATVEEGRAQNLRAIALKLALFLVVLGIAVGLMLWLGYLAVVFAAK